jgi:hypothetical protein
VSIDDLAVLLAAAGPDQGEALAVFVVEEVGVDRGVEARIVELEAQIVAALVGALGPGGADLGAADQTRWLGAFSPVARRSGTMRTPLAWTLRVTISPVNSFEPVFLKVPMVAI